LDSGHVEGALAGRQADFFAVRVDPDIAAKLAAHGVTVKGVASGGIVETVLSWIIPAAIFYLIWMMLFQRMADRQGLGGLMAIGKSRAKVYVETNTKVTFKDVAGSKPPAGAASAAA
jgi:cell division protease FtsH